MGKVEKSGEWSYLWDEMKTPCQVNHLSGLLCAWVLITRELSLIFYR